MLACLVLASLAAPQTTWYVDASGTAPGAGTPADPYTSVAHALAQPATLSGDRVEVAPGTYPDERIDFLGKAVHVRGTQGPAATVLVANTAVLDSTVVRFTSGEGAGSVLEGFELRTGHGSPLQAPPFGQVGAGGGLLILGSSPTVTDCWFTASTFTCDLGGGAAVVGPGAAPRFERCRFRGGPPGISPALRGGAAYVVDATAAFAACEFESARADAGGALWTSGGDLLLDRCSFAQNRAFLRGGAVFASQARLFVSDSTFQGNRADYDRGGAVFATGSVTQILDSEFVDNAALDDHRGGALNLDVGSASVRDCSFVDNSANDGGAINSSALLDVRDCVFAGNRAWAGMAGTGTGGAICVEGAGSATATRSVFLQNSSSYSFGPEAEGGGAVFGALAADRCTFVLNTSAGRGGGAAGGGASIRGSILWANQSTVPGASQVTASTAVAYSIVDGGWPGAGNLADDPRFWAAADLHLLPGSPAIDAGDPLDPPDPDGSRADMGAYVFDPWHCGPGCTGPVGTSTCTSTTNSTGQDARLAALGSDVALNNLVILNGTRLPSNTAGYMLASLDPGFVPLFGGSQGVLCLGGTILRFSNTVLGSGPAGVMSFRPDLLDLPQGTIAAAGDTWSFQLWFRDSAGGQATSNTTQSIELVLR